MKAPDKHFPGFDDKAANKSLFNVGIGARFHNVEIGELPNGEILNQWFKNTGHNLFARAPGIMFHAGKSAVAYDLFIHLAKLCWSNGITVRVAGLDDIADAFTHRDDAKQAILREPKVLFVHPFQDAGQSPLTVREQRAIERLITERVDARKAVALFTTTGTTVNSFPWWSPSAISMLRGQLEIVSVA